VGEHWRRCHYEISLFNYEISFITNFRNDQVQAKVLRHQGTGGREGGGMLLA
jgi:hypothetical protein